MKHVATIILFFSFVSIAIADNTITMVDNKLTIKATNANLSEVSQRLETLSGIKFIIEENIKKDLISIDIEKQDIEKAISRLLKHYSKSLEYNQQGKLTSVRVEPKASHDIKAAKNPSIAERQSANSSSAKPLQTSQPTSSTPLMKMEMSSATSSPTEMGPFNPVIEENPTKMLVEQPTGQKNIPGKIEKHLSKMEVTKTNQAAPMPHQQSQ